MLLFLILALIASLVFALETSDYSSDYHERLTIQPLPLGSLLASFEFQSNETLSAFEQQNFRYFPRSLGQILQHADTKELHLRFTTGRWDAETWGARPWDGTREGGTGVELWAWIDASTDEEAFQKWTTLTQSLSGLFCASLNFIDSTRTTKPVLSFGTTGDHITPERSLHLLHGVLPGEVVCTENLTPFLKLLPCKGKAGISSLLDGHKVFDSSWQSMSIDVRPKCSLDSNVECQIEISQTIDMVLDIERSKRPRDNPIPRPPSVEHLRCDTSKPYHSSSVCYPRDHTEEVGWTLSEVFGRSMSGSCPLTASEGPAAKSVCVVVPHERNILISASGFEVKSPPGTVPESRCYQLMAYPEPFDMEFRWQTLSAEAQAQIPASLGSELLLTTRTMTGTGASLGGIYATFTNPSPHTPVSFTYFESLPWFMRPYMHSLNVSLLCTEYPFSTGPLITSIHYTPSIPRARPTHLEVALYIPPASTMSLSYAFEKAILRYTEYPPDANRGFNVAPAVIRVLGEHDPVSGAPRDVYLRTPSLLLSLPTPDFSMPYNVIILTSTVMALAFGSVFNILVRRFVGLEEAGDGLASKVRNRLQAVKGLLLGLLGTVRGEKVTKAE